MRNCLIMGSGRSGTSMVAGALAPAGYHMGHNLHAGRDSNPKGFFEDREINEINELLLAPIVPKRYWFMGRWFMKQPFAGPRRAHGERWLARIPLDVSIPSPPDLTERIREAVCVSPFCFKDPRFCYTLPAWRPFVKDAGFICVFRDPATTAASMIKEVDKYLGGLVLTFDRALAIWGQMYKHVLRIHRHEGSWLFLHYNQAIDTEGLNRLEAFTEASVDRSFPDPSLRRSSSTHPLPEDIQELYEELCSLARYEER